MSDRLKKPQLRISSNKKRYYRALKYPEIPLSFNDTYVTTTSGDRLDFMMIVIYGGLFLYQIQML